MNSNILSLMLPKELMRHIGGKVKARRAHLNLSRRELSDKCGISQSTITRLENKGIATLQVIIKVAIALNSIETFENLFNSPKAKTLEEFVREKQ